ncbi:hypothetical protein HPB52_007695 [Rhipicephalus sanguineus]|uniref:Uncharacterized protein n=1 Tax=Rhipicephalus sanguineus TaxID=34632 RepID=A0A9D4SXZ2_RHISA|nr:hypothetical protein HPB52_007695 [Rhipicephalus sanguineus]
MYATLLLALLLGAVAFANSEETHSQTRNWPGGEEPNPPQKQAQSPRVEAKPKENNLSLRQRQKTPSMWAQLRQKHLLSPNLSLNLKSNLECSPRRSLNWLRHPREATLRATKRHQQRKQNRLLNRRKPSLKRNLRSRQNLNPKHSLMPSRSLKRSHSQKESPSQKHNLNHNPKRNQSHSLNNSQRRSLSQSLKRNPTAHSKHNPNSQRRSLRKHRSNNHNLRQKANQAALPSPSRNQAATLKTRFLNKRTVS